MTFEINADGIVSVHAKDVETGKEQSITVTATSGLTEDEIDEMMVGRVGLRGVASRRRGHGGGPAGSRNPHRGDRAPLAGGRVDRRGQ